MGHAANARDLRRETKRTLGRHLQEFATDHLARLEQIEHRSDEQSKRVRRLTERLEEEAYTRGRVAAGLNFRLEVFERLTFWQRLDWLFTGMLPMPAKPGPTLQACGNTSAEEVTTTEGREAFAQDIGRP